MTVYALDGAFGNALGSQMIAINERREVQNAEIDRRAMEREQWMAMVGGSK